MITSTVFAGRDYAVLGLARSGRATVDALVASGANVMAWDVDADRRAAVAGKARLADPLTTSIYGYSAIVVSPGVPINRHPIAERARAAGDRLIRYAGAGDVAGAAKDYEALAGDSDLDDTLRDLATILSAFVAVNASNTGVCKISKS